jgi:DNA-binding NtrC family response regulator
MSEARMTMTTATTNRQTRPFPPAPPGSRVLIVDDEPRLCDMLVRSTTEMGFVAVAVQSCVQALRVLEADDVDILLLDLTLPGMGGMELLERLRGRGDATQVVILTGFGNLESAKRAIRLDAVDFLTKPCALDELELALSRAKRRRMETLSPQDLLPPATGAAPPPGAAGMTLEELERAHILAALDRNGGNRADTAAELGISERTLYYRLGQYAHDD